MLNALENAVVLAGSQAALADLIGVKQQTISLWLTKLRSRPNDPIVPAEAAVQIELATNGQVDKGAMRPDLFSDPIRSNALDPCTEIVNSKTSSRPAVADA